MINENSSNSLVCKPINITMKSLKQSWVKLQERSGYDKEFANYLEEIERKILESCGLHEYS